MTSAFTSRWVAKPRRVGVDAASARPHRRRDSDEFNIHVESNQLRTNPVERLTKDG